MRGPHAAMVHHERTLGQEQIMGHRLSQHQHLGLLLLPALLPLVPTGGQLGRGAGHGECGVDDGAEWALRRHLVHPLRHALQDTGHLSREGSPGGSGVGCVG